MDVLRPAVSGKKWLTMKFMGILIVDSSRSCDDTAAVTVTMCGALQSSFSGQKQADSKTQD